MFGKIEQDEKRESAFQSDLKNAIEMNVRGKLLRNSKLIDSKKDIELPLNDDAVIDAFDIDRKSKPSNIAKVTSEDDEEKKDNEENKALIKKSKKKPEKEGIAKPETGLLPSTDHTPGGPDDDDQDVPPAPNPPNIQKQDIQNVDDYDLL